MATDLVERLRIWPAADGIDGLSSLYVHGLVTEAAAEIERLRAALKEIADHDSIDDYGHALIAQAALGKAWKA